MRGELRKFAMVLAMTTGVATLPLWATQHFGGAPHAAAPRQAGNAHPQVEHAQRQRMRQERQAEQRQERQAARQQMRMQRRAGAETMRMNAGEAGRGYAAQHEVPRPPERQSMERSSVPHPPEAQRNVPRPPERNEVPHPPASSMRETESAGQQAGMPRSAQQHDVPKPPDARQGNSSAAPVGNAPRMVPRPPVIGTPRDVHNGPHAGDWLRRYGSLPAQQRERALENDPAFRRLPPAQQERYRNQLNRFASEPAQQQARTINRLDAWGHLSAAQQQQARNTYGQLKSMPPERQQAINQTFRRLRAMPPSAREQVMNSPEYQSRFSPQEQSVIRSMTEINDSLPH